MDRKETGPVGRRAVIAGLAVLVSAAVVCTDRANAAVRICQGEVSSGLKIAATETQARKLAMAAWIDGARAYGAGYTSWRLAVGRLFSCAKADDGGFQCLARAEPCTILQKAPPSDVVPPRKGKGIEG